MIVLRRAGRELREPAAGAGVGASRAGRRSGMRERPAPPALRVPSDPWEKRGQTVRTGRPAPPVHRGQRERSDPPEVPVRLRAAGISGIRGESRCQRETPGLVWQGAWAPLVPYSQADVVEFAGSSYVAVTASLGSQPPDADWALLAQAGAAGNPGAPGEAGATSACGSHRTYGARRTDGRNGPDRGGRLARIDRTSRSRGDHRASRFAGTDRANGCVRLHVARCGLGIHQGLQPGDAVEHEGSSYVALAANSGSQPPDAAWALLAQAGAAGGPGATGEAGATGAAGPVGPTGPDGLLGGPGPAPARIVEPATPAPWDRREQPVPPVPGDPPGQPALPGQPVPWESPELRARTASPEEPV